MDHLKEEWMSGGKEGAISSAHNPFTLINP